MQKELFAQLLVLVKSELERLRLEFAGDSEILAEFDAIENAAASGNFKEAAKILFGEAFPKMVARLPDEQRQEIMNAIRGRETQTGLVINAVEFSPTPLSFGLHPYPKSFRCYLCKLEEREQCDYGGIPYGYDYATKYPVCDEHANEPTSVRVRTKDE